MDKQPTTADDEFLANGNVVVLLGSTGFDAAFYAGQCAIPGLSVPHYAMHYLTIGEAQGLLPSERFDPKFYLATNRDVREGGGSPLTHYILHGQAEGRHPTRARLRAAALYIEQSGLFDARAFARHRTRPAAPGLTAAEDYIAGRDQVSIGEAFDNEAYSAWYGQDLARHVVPLLHYLDIGMAEARVPTRRELQQRHQAIAASFNAAHYLAQIAPGEAIADPAEHYILHGNRRGLEPEPNFSPDYYIRRYPDLQGAGLDLYSHYVMFGHAEGRVGKPDFLDMTEQGAVAFDGDKPTIVVASHEASRTGAPLVGLNVGARLCETHNVIAVLGRGGTLAESFKECCCLLVTGALDALHAEYLLLLLKQSHTLGSVLLNSVETGQFGRAALYAGLPCVALIHEFAEYTLPTGRMSGVVEAVDRAIAPADLIRDSILAELAQTRSGQIAGIRVRPQGCLPELPRDETEADMTREEILALIGAPPDHPVRIVLGAGYVQMRKGVDLFVQTAAELRKLAGDGVRFVWVGDGYHPKTDLAYSAWVADMVRRLGLEGMVFFLPSQSSLDLLFEMASVFFLPSRLDPFPNVALDAVRAGRAVICFEQATGIAGLFARETALRGEAAAYCSTVDAARALTAALAPEAVAQAEDNRHVAERVFGFADYIADIGTELAAAAKSQAALVAEAARIEQSGLFDPEFYNGKPTTAGPAEIRRSILDYVAQGMKGLMQYSPRPGFNEGLARALCGRGPALGRPGAPRTTHRCHILEEQAAIRPFPGRIALHLHLYYPELAGQFLDDLTIAKSSADLFVTTTSEDKKLEIAYALRKYRGGSCTVTVVPNRGRDIGPLFTQLRPEIAAGGYDLVGHLHGKRSLSTDAAMGTRWRTFLVDTLLGGRSGMAGVLAPFTADAKLGLLFAEDRHVVGWSDNRAIAEALAARMQPAAELPAWPIFPVGTMFWARPAALAPLWTLDLGLEDFPHEPVRYDGTVLHAIERLLPSVCTAAGYEWATVYRAGRSW